MTIMPSRLIAAAVLNFTLRFRNMKIDCLSQQVKEYFPAYSPSNILARA